MKRILSVFLAVIIVATSLVSVIGVTAETTTKSASVTDNSSKRLSVSTNTKGARYLVDANGNIVHLFGMARCQTHAIEEHYDHGGSVNTLARHYADMGLNYMRLAINVDSIIGDTINDSIKLTDAEIDKWITNNVDPDVKAIIGEGMYVGLDLHMISIGGVDSLNNMTATKVGQYVTKNFIPILKRLTLYYKDEPMIANVEIWNEPSIGVKTGSDGVSWRQTLRNFYIDAVKELRKIDATRILMVSDDNAGWGWNIGDFWSGYTKYLGENIVYSAHVSHDQFDANGSYSGYAGWVKGVADSLNICIMFNEVEAEPGTSTDKSIENFCKFLDETKDKYHFSSALWRPHADYVNKAWIWGTNGWAAAYTGCELKTEPNFIWFRTDGVASSNGWGGELSTISSLGNSVFAPDGITGYTSEYAMIKHAACDRNGGDILFTRNNFYESSNQLSTDLNGYEYVIVKMKFATKEVAEYALSRNSNGDPFIKLSNDAYASFEDYKAQLNKNSSKALACEWVTLVLPLSKKLDDRYLILSMDLGYNAAVNSETYIHSIEFATAEYANDVLNMGDSFYKNTEFPLYNGSNYKFTGHAWYPQLNVGGAERVVVSRYTTSVQFDLTMPDYATLQKNFTNGSRSSIGGGSFTYSPSLDLALYFSGENVNGIGVTKSNLFNVLKSHSTDLSAGKTVKVTLPISGKFTDGSAVESLHFMFAHDDKASAFSNKSFSISNFEFVIDDPNSVLKGGPKYTFSGAEWWPQLVINTQSNCNVSSDTRKVRFSVRIPDYATLRPLMKWGSRGGGVNFDEFESYGSHAFGIYFGSVKYVGITQYDIFKAFDKNSAALSAGETVTLTFNISGEFKDDDVITDVRFMLTHSSDAAGFNGKDIYISNFEFIDVIYASSDLNCDETVNALDAVMIKKILFNTEIAIINKNRGDINSDGVVDILDYVKLYEAILTEK